MSRGSLQETHRSGELGNYRSPELLLKIQPWGFHSPYGSDGDDGDGQGSRFWGVRYVPQGEAPFSAPQAKKTLA